MDGSPDERMVREAGGDRIVDQADHRRVTTDLEVQPATRVEAPPARLDVRRVDHPLGVVLTLAGELDLATVPVLQERLDQVICAKAAVIIDLSRLRFIDSSGLDLLVRAERQLRDSGPQLVLVRGPRAVHRVFELTSLDSHFDFCDPQARPPEPSLCDASSLGGSPGRRRPTAPRPNSTAAWEE